MTPTATAARTKNKKKLNMVGPPIFNNCIVNEIHQEVQTFQGGLGKRTMRYMAESYIFK